MKIRSEKGFTGIDISVSVIILFIFITIISVLVYRVNSTSREITLRSDATHIAINEIEQVKIKGYDEYGDRSVAAGNSVDPENEEITEHEGFYRTIIVEDYKDIIEKQDEANGTNEADSIMSGIVKKVTVRITYMYHAEEQTVEISTLLSKGS